VSPEAFDGFDPRAYLPTAAPGSAEASLDALVAHNRKSAKTHSGIWRDLAVRKRPTEVDAQLGIVVRLGQEAGVPTPLTARLVELIHDIEAGRREQSIETLTLLSDTDVRHT
jgi:2-dehydropantoate 2-reductase